MQLTETRAGWTVSPPHNQVWTREESQGIETEIEEEEEEKEEEVLDLHSSSVKSHN